jgi:hypothetical protein
MDRGTIDLLCKPRGRRILTNEWYTAKAVHLLLTPGHWDLEATSLEGREPEAYIEIRIFLGLTNTSTEAVFFFPVSGIPGARWCAKSWPLCRRIWLH